MAWILKTNDHYKMLLSQCAQQTLRVVDRGFRSFFQRLKKKNKGNHDQPVGPPKYLPKDSLFPLIYLSKQRKIVNGKLLIPFGRKIKEETGKRGIYVNVPNYITNDVLLEVRIIPRYNRFEIEFIYNKQEEIHDLNASKTLGIDLGLDNLMTCVDCSTGRSFIIDGRKIKSYNHWWNERVAKYQSVISKEGIKRRTKYLKHLDGNRFWFINDYLNQAINKVIKYCIANNIGTIVIGENKEWKQEINLGKRNNQNFVQIPHGKLKYKLKCKCEFHGIEYIPQEESYTSKCSFLDNESIEKHQEYFGKRVYRGLFRAGNGFFINADVNSALNIVRKSKQKVVLNDQLCKGLSSSPARVRVHLVPSQTKHVNKF
jgi:IS605 OrfB family transposase